MELRRYVLIIRRWLWMLVLATAIAAAAGYAFSLRQPKEYRATATLIINEAQASTGPTYNDILASQQLTQTYVSIATSRPVLATAAQNLGYSEDTFNRLVQISATSPLNTTLIKISAVSRSPVLSTQAANAASDSFGQAIKQSQLGDEDTAAQDLSNQIQSVQSNIQKTNSDIQAASLRSGSSSELAALQNQLGQEQTTYGSLLTQLEDIKLSQSRATNVVKLVEPAIAPKAPFTPRTLLNAAIAAFLGLLAGACVAFFLEYWDDRVQSPEDVEQAAPGTSTLGIIERLLTAGSESSGVGEDRLIPAGSHSSRALEEYRLLRSNLEFAGAGRPNKVLLITSAQVSEGKTTTAANLAIVMAQTGKRVVLVDADLRRPSVHRVFGVPNTAGLSTLFLMDRPDVEALSVQTAYENLRVITSGPVPPNPSELLGSARMRQLIGLLSASFDHVIFDSPPILALADAAEIAARVDGVVLVADTSKTRPAALAHARESIDRASGTLLGVVLNKLQRKQLRSGYYYYYYYSAYGDYRGKAASTNGHSNGHTATAVSEKSNGKRH